MERQEGVLYNQGVDDDDDDDDLDDFGHPLASPSSHQLTPEIARNEYEKSSFRATSTTTPMKLCDEDDTWSTWYHSTFSRELAMIKGHSDENFDPSTKTKTSETTTTSLVIARTVDKSSKSEFLDESRILRRRLNAIDALHALNLEVDAVGVVPIPRRLWESDASNCRACDRDLGWTHLRRRHHCRYCGLTFCDDCTCGEIRRCTYCTVQKTRSDAIKMLRQSERQYHQDTPDEDDVLMVAKAYRTAIQLFGNQPRDVPAAVKQARAILIEGMQSFLELAEFKLKATISSTEKGTPGISSRSFPHPQ
jgi:hypothetical protein